MSVATTTAIGIAAGVGVAGSIGSAAIGANAAGNAASTQANAAKSAAQLQADEQQKALDFQKQEWETQQQNQAPFLKAGQQGVNSLANLLKTPGQGLLTPWNQTFQAPTLAEAEQMPGYQFQLGQGDLAIKENAAAGGTLGAPQTVTAEEQFNQGLAQSDYSTEYNRVMQQYQQAYNIFQNNQANTYNRLANEAGMGQTTAAQLGQEGQAASGNVGNIDITGGAQQAQQINNAAAARASGYVGEANAYSQIPGSIASTASTLPFYLQMLNQGGGNGLGGMDPSVISGPAVG